MHLALAHRSAVCLYIHRAIPAANLLANPQVNLHVETIVSNLSVIGYGNSLLKGTSWPTFIAGAEATSDRHVAWVLWRLDMVWKVLPWGYLNTTTELLNRIWRNRKMRPESDGSSWLQELRGQGNDWIVV
jgi:hypothetical protein